MKIGQSRPEDECENVKLFLARSISVFQKILSFFVLYSELGNQNVSVAQEIFGLKKVRIVGTVIGGTCGRKVVFNTTSGETVIANVDNIRGSDWYPPLIKSAKKN